LGLTNLGEHAPSADPRLTELAALLDERARNPVDERERASVAAFHAALARLDRPFDEGGGPTHVTSSAIVVGTQGVLLLRHKHLGLWVQPGGHLDPGEGLAAGALREAAEETGLALAHPPGGPRLVHVDVHPGGRGHTHLDLRWLLFSEGAPRPPPGESQDVAWFAWPAAVKSADPGLAGALRGLRLIFGAPET
jgi:8-oxo-dGTP pyrophosphatase MutT (NUDIX family)